MLLRLLSKVIKITTRDAALSKTISPVWLNEAGETVLLGAALHSLFFRAEVDAEHRSGGRSEQSGQQICHEPRDEEGQRAAHGHLNGEGNVEEIGDNVARTDEEIVYHIDAEAADADVAEQLLDALTLDGKVLTEPKHRDNHHGYVERAEQIEQLIDLGRAVGLCAKLRKNR